MDAKIEKCTQHELKNCVVIIINDCEYHTDSTENRKLIIEELEWVS